MSEPRAHHLVPQFHLKRFADAKKRVQLVSRNQKRSFVISVRKACVECDFYAVETKDGWSQEVEKLLSEMEGAAAPAIERMLNGEFPPSQSDREAVALMVAFQCLRGGDFREGYGQLVDHIAKLMMANVTREDLREMHRQKEGKDPSEAELAELAEVVRKMSGVVKAVPHQNETVGLMLKMAPGLGRMVAARKWVLVDVAEPCLLTSDVPVARWTDRQKPGADVYGTGWGTADQLLMPLSPRYCLTMLLDAPATAEQVFRAGRLKGPEIAKGVNVGIAAGASRWIVHHPEGAPLKDVVLPPPLPPLRIDGPVGRIIPEDV